MSNPEHETRKTFHTSLLSRGLDSVSVGIKNAGIGLQKRRLRLNNNKVTGLGQSLRDTFPPKLTT